MRWTKQRFLGVAVATFLGAGSAFAGYQWSGGTIDVDLSEPYVTGTLGGPGHSSSSDSYYLGCSITGQTGQALAGECHMKDSAGDSGSCTLSAFDAARALNGDSYS